MFPEGLYGAYIFDNLPSLEPLALLLVVVPSITYRKSRMRFTRFGIDMLVVVMISAILRTVKFCAVARTEKG